MSLTLSTEEPDVQYVVLPVPADQRRGVAQALLAAAGEDRVELVATVSEGFRVPYGIAREAGVLDYIANEDVTPVTTEPVKVPTEVQPPVQTPVQTPVETPVEPPVETPAEEAPAEEAPAEAAAVTEEPEAPKKGRRAAPEA